MNRRNFLSSLVKAAGLFTILPPASTYDRIWKATPKVFIPKLHPYQKAILNPEWVKAEYEVKFFSLDDIKDLSDKINIFAVPLGTPIVNYRKVVC